MASVTMAIVALIWFVPLAVCLLLGIVSWISPRFRRFCSYHLFGPDEPQPATMSRAKASLFSSQTIKSEERFTEPAVFSYSFSSWSQAGRGAIPPVQSACKTGKVDMRVNLQMETARCPPGKAGQLSSGRDRTRNEGQHSANRVLRFGQRLG
jgi:hypothetical protein